IAGYLALVTPASKDRSDYDLPRLLVRARALETLPGWTPQVEVYHATAPLVHATGEPLATPELARLRREETVGWHGGAAIAPLLGGRPTNGSRTRACSSRRQPRAPIGPGSRTWRARQAGGSWSPATRALRTPCAAGAAASSARRWWFVWDPATGPSCGRRRR